MMTTYDFSFKPLEEKDLDQLCQWLKKPHVKEWWDENLSDEQSKAKYRKRINDHFVMIFMVSLNDKPLGVVQHYFVSTVSDGLWPDEGEGTVGIDVLIGEKDNINHGVGTELLNQYIKKLFADSAIKKVITDVNPANSRAIRCYEKVGFKHVKDVMTPDGYASLYELNKIIF
jgi:RimJ/RimL family protein N-acetyltransferase